MIFGTVVTPAPKKAPFGNDPSKIAGYRSFWKREAVRRPLVGFSLVGWFPLDEFAACRPWASAEYLTPDMIDPEAFLPDHVRILREGEWMDDDIIRGACPGQVAIPWLPGMLGCRMRILPHNVLGEERRLDWEEALRVRLDRQNPWYRKYFEFADALVRFSAASFPVSHAAELGPIDLVAALRGHTQSVWDLADEPDAFIHLHSTSMFLLDAFLECEEIQCFEVNRDALGPPVREMAVHFRKIQQAARPHIMVRDRKETEPLRSLLGM
jgi:hypothetical protein